MIASKQPLLSSDTQLQPGTSSDSKSTMMDCLAKTADQRRSKVRCGLHKACPITRDGFSLLHPQQVGSYCKLLAAEISAFNYIKQMRVKKIYVSIFVSLSLAIILSVLSVHPVFQQDGSSL